MESEYRKYNKKHNVYFRKASAGKLIFKLYIERYQCLAALKSSDGAQTNLTPATYI